MAFDPSAYQPGQILTCTIARLPQSQADEKTIERLMRLDADHKRALKRSQRMRQQRLLVYNRGNRDWVSRERPARVVRCETGRTWALPYRFDLAHDLKAVAEFLTIKA